MAVMKKLGAIVMDLIYLVIIISAVLISIMVFTSKASGYPNLFGYSPFVVQTQSMEPTILVDDLIIDRACDSSQLQVGDIITFYTMIEGNRAVNTHRIVDVVDMAGTTFYQTQGDNAKTNAVADESLVAPGDVIAQYTGIRVARLGSVVNFLSTQLGFFLVILLPVLLFTIWQAYRLIVIIVNNKKADLMRSVVEGTSDEIKQAVVAEYLANQDAARAEETGTGEELPNQLVETSRVEDQSDSKP